MSYFDQIYARLFGKKNTKTSVMVNELIKRSQHFIHSFDSWKSSETCTEFLSDLWESYFWRRQGIEKNPPIVLHESNHSNGFAIGYIPSYSKSDFHFLLDYFADQVKKLDYRLVMSRHTMQEKGDTVEKKEMHYLKPKYSFEEPIDQKYGNVQIEYLEVDNEPTRIKFIANSYPDRKYTEALSFEVLAQHVFNVASES